MSSFITVDTQVIVSAEYLGDASEIRGCHACSVALAEYLMMQTDNYLSAAYYLPTRTSPAVGGPIDWNRLQKERPSAWARRRTRSIPVVLRSTVPPVTILYWGMTALADIINDRDRARFQTAVSRLVPRSRLRILHKLDFVLQADMSCDALTREDAELGLELMTRFMKANTLKEDVRNTVNDMLVLASSMNRGLVLRTDDTLLDNFAESQLDAHSTPHGNNLVDLGTPKIACRRQGTGTKGYVNHFQ